MPFPICMDLGQMESRISRWVSFRCKTDNNLYRSCSAMADLSTQTQARTPISIAFSKAAVPTLVSHTPPWKEYPNNLRHRNEIRPRNTPSNQRPIHNKPLQPGRLHRDKQGHSSRAGSYGDGSQTRPVHQLQPGLRRRGLALWGYTYRAPCSV